MKLILRCSRHLLDGNIHESARRDVQYVVPGIGTTAVLRISGDGYTVPAGEYPVEKIPNPLIPGGKEWVVLVGTKIGATLGSMTQWTGEAWGEMEMIVLNDHGQKIINKDEGEYTLEVMKQRIDDGTITDPTAKARYIKMMHRKTVGAK